MKYNFSELIDVEKVQALTDTFSEMTGIANAIIDLDGEIITGSGWQRICLDFHRPHAVCGKRCIESDTILAQQMLQGEKVAIYECMNGLIDAAAPIVIEGEHVANFFTGQYLFEAPNEEFFRAQAAEHGFDESAYLAALAEVPVVPRDNLKVIMKFLAQLAAFIGEMGLNRVRQLEAAEKLQQEISERRQTEEALELVRYSVDQATDAVFWFDSDANFTDANKAAYRNLGYTREELLNMTVFDIDPVFPKEEWENLKQQVKTRGGLNIETQHRTKDGRDFPVEVNVYHLEFEGREQYFSFARDITARKEAEAERARLQQRALEAQQQVIQELSTPIIPLMQGIIVMPLVGIIDTMRARDITRTLLAGISEYRARVVILDITGVPVVDSGIAAHLDKTIQAARLKGARVIITGISDAVAEAIVDLGIDWRKIETLRDLQTGLITALERMGIRLSKESIRS